MPEADLIFVKSQEEKLEPKENHILGGGHGKFQFIYFEPVCG